MVAVMRHDARYVAQRYYRGSGREFRKDAESLLSNPRGIFIYSPQLVVMMKPVLLREELLWTALEDNPTDADAWYIHLLAGDLKLARRLAADIAPLEWFCFHRGRRDGRPHLLNRAYVLPAPNNRKEK